MVVVANPFRITLVVVSPAARWPLSTGTTQPLTVDVTRPVTELCNDNKRHYFAPGPIWVRSISIRKVYVDLYSAFYAKRLKCAQTWITQITLQITPCLPLLPSRRTSPAFGWYSFYRPTEGRMLSRPGWLVAYRNKMPPPGVEPGHGHPSQY